jgi:threonine/homoserine/homoserine lactone efflux protein
MPDAPALALFMAAGLALNLTPGPDMLYVAARAAAEGRAAGIASTLGIATGTLVHIALVAFGLTALLAAVPVAYTAVRLAGAAYLVYLGVRTLLRPGGLTERALTPASRWAVFRQGVVTNVLNPKVALFFLAFLPQFVDPARGSAGLQVLGLGLLFDASGTLVLLAVALGASRAAGRLRRSAGAARWLERATGVLFVGLGVRLALAGRR